MFDIIFLKDPETQCSGMYSNNKTMLCIKENETKPYDSKLQRKRKNTNNLNDVSYISGRPNENNRDGS